MTLSEAFIFYRVPESEHLHWEERAAIMQFMGKRSRELSETQCIALLELEYGDMNVAHEGTAGSAPRQSGVK